MDHIKETIVSLEYNNAGDDRATTTYSTSFRFFKTYGWSPWNTLFMEECDIVILNLGLRYDAHSLLGANYGSPKFLDDFRAAVTYLVDFVASRKDRIAVWR